MTNIEEIPNCIGHLLPDDTFESLMAKHSFCFYCKFYLCNQNPCNTDSLYYKSLKPQKY